MLQTEENTPPITLKKGIHFQNPLPIYNFCPMFPFLKLLVQQRPILDNKKLWWKKCMLFTTHEILFSYHRKELLLDVNEFGWKDRPTFSLVAKITLVHLLISLIAMNHWTIHQLKIKNDFLHKDLNDEIYIEQSPRFIAQRKSELVYGLKKSLYGF